MFKLLKKEFALCMHPTSIPFLLFSLFVFIPNYPYEVMFFFSGLSVFFVCLTGRENGDLAFSCGLPVRKQEIALARMLFCGILQVALFVLAGVFTAVKEVCFPPEAQINLAGSTANLAFLGYGALLLGIFNLVFFPWYFKNPAKVGMPFIVAAAVQFFVIALLIVLRFTAPLFSQTLAAVDPLSMAAKAVVFTIGVLGFVGGTALAAYLSARIFARTDL